MNVFPNPTSGTLNIMINSKTVSNTSFINIIDITGNIVKTKTVNLEIGNNIIQDDTNELSSGIYFIQVKCNEAMITKKLVVIK